MPRPSFSVVASTLVILTAFAVVRRYVAPLIPAPYDAVSDATSDYLRAGEVQPLRWRPLSSDLLAQARRENRPILLLMGSLASPAARALDSDVLNDPEVVRMVAGRFLPARLDLAASPAWRAALEPVGRTATNADEGLTMLALSPGGRPILGASPVALGVGYSRDEFAGFIAAARAALLANELPSPAERLRARDDVLLAGGRRELPTRDAGLGLRARTDRARGLVLVPGGGRVSPWTLNAIASAGEILFAADALRGLATSPMNDPLDGGVFLSIAAARNGPRIETTKGLVLNAALAETAARVAVRTGDATLDRFARRTADWCLRALNHEAPAFVVSDAGSEGFSPYYSLTFRRLRGAGIRSDAGSFRSALGADHNPQALGSLARAPSEIVEGDLALLARSGPIPPARHRGIASVRAATIARLLGVARLLNDEPRARELGAQLDALEIGMDRAGADLPLLLALADAHWADFLTNGRAEGLELAARDLARAIARFGSPSGTIRAGDGIPGLGLAPDAPDLADGTTEATAAVAVRLADAVGRTLEKGAEARRLRRWARSCAQRYAPILGTSAATPNGAFTPESAAFLDACAGLTDRTWRVVTGPDPVHGAIAELRRHPFSLVVPAVGSAAPSVSRDASGTVLLRADD